MNHQRLMCRMLGCHECFELATDRAEHEKCHVRPTHAEEPKVDLSKLNAYPIPEIDPLLVARALETHVYRVPRAQEAECNWCKNSVRLLWEPSVQQYKFDRHSSTGPGALWHTCPYTNATVMPDGTQIAAIRR